MSTQDLLSGRHAADGHQLSRVGRVWLTDRHVCDAGEIESPLQFEELGLVPRRKDDRMRSFGEVPRTGLAGRMDQLRSLHASWEVGADDDVVVTHFLDSARVRGG